MHTSGCGVPENHVILHVTEMRKFVITQSLLSCAIYVFLQIHIRFRNLEPK